MNKSSCICLLLSTNSHTSTFIRTRVKVSPEVGGGGVQEQAECRQNKAQLIASLQAELAELRLDILRRRKDNLLEAPQPSSSRRTTEAGRTRASFVEYVSEVCSCKRGSLRILAVCTLAACRLRESSCEGGASVCFQEKNIDGNSQVWPHSSSRNTAILTGSSSSTLGGGGAGGGGGGGGGGVARELSVSSDRQGGGGGRNPRPYSGSRYKYLGELGENSKTARLRMVLTVFIFVGAFFQQTNCCSETR